MDNRTKYEHPNFFVFKFILLFWRLRNSCLLPKVYDALGIEAKKRPAKPGFAAQMKQFTNVDPYQCILCGNRMIFTHAEAGFRPEELLAKRRHQFQRELWLRQAA